MIEIYTDGSCKGNPGKGGWGVYIKEGLKEIELYGMEENTTNNRMELMGIIEPLRLLKESCKVIIYTDSMYIVNSMNKGWLKGWVKRNWKRSDKEPVANIDLWKIMLEVQETHQLEFNWIRGHNEHEENERCDELAVLARQGDVLEIDTEYEKSCK